MFRIARVGLSLILALMALAGAVLTLDLTELRQAEQAEQIAKLRFFERAARFAHSHHQRTGKYPVQEKLVTSLSGAGVSPPNIGVDGEQEDGAWRVGCSQEESFSPASSDRFVLSAWNGNWFDCFGYPSGTTNLRTAKSHWMSEALYLEALSLLLAFAAWAAWPARNSRERPR